MKKYCFAVLCSLLLLLASCDFEPTRALLAPSAPPDPVESAALFLCFDDGYESWDWAVDILDSLEMKGNFFVHSRWLCLNQAGMDWWDALRYRDSGHSVLNHARNNKPLPPDSIDIFIGYQNIEGRNMDTTCFAFPNSRSDSATVSHVALYHQVARLCSLRLTLQSHFEAGEYDLKAVMVAAETLSVRYRHLLANAKAEGKVLMLVFHKLCDEPDCGVGGRVHIDKLREIVEYADALGIRAYTFAEYLDR